jgi:hypothetical protein
MPDSDPIIAGKPHDFSGMFGGILSQIQYKLLFGVIGMFLFFSSAYYVENVLVHFDSATELDRPTGWGYGITVMFLAMGFILLDALCRTGVL